MFRENIRRPDTPKTRKVSRTRVISVLYVCTPPKTHSLNRESQAIITMKSLSSNSLRGKKPPTRSSSPLPRYCQSASSCALQGIKQNLEIYKQNDYAMNIKFQGQYHRNTPGANTITRTLSICCGNCPAS